MTGRSQYIRYNGVQSESALVLSSLLCMIMFKCLRGSAPSYLADCCTNTTSLVPGRSALRSAAHGDIVVPGHRTDWGLRSFADCGSWPQQLECFACWFEVFLF